MLELYECNFQFQDITYSREKTMNRSHVAGSLCKYLNIWYLFVRSPGFSRNPKMSGNFEKFHFAYMLFFLNGR